MAREPDQNWPRSKKWPFQDHFLIRSWPGPELKKFSLDPKNRLFWSIFHLSREGDKWPKSFLKIVRFSKIDRKLIDFDQILKNRAKLDFWGQKTSSKSGQDPEKKSRIKPNFDQIRSRKDQKSRILILILENNHFQDLKMVIFDHFQPFLAFSPKIFSQANAWKNGESNISCTGIFWRLVFTPFLAQKQA